MLMLQKLWAVQWVWPIIAYVFILYSEIWTNLSYGHPLIPRRPDKRGLTVIGLPEYVIGGASTVGEATLSQFMTIDN